MRAPAITQRPDRPARRRFRAPSPTAPRVPGGAYSAALLLWLTGAAPLRAEPADADGAAALAAPRASTSLLPLQAAVRQALRHNRQLRALRAQLRAAEGRVLQAEGESDVVLSGELTLSRDETPGQVLAAPSRGHSYELRVGRPLPWGGALALFGRTSYLRAGAPEGPAVTGYRHDVGIALQQPLLRGAGITAGLGPERRAHAALALAQHEHRAAVTALLRELIHAYWDLAFAREERDIDAQALALAREQERLTRARIRAGRLPPATAIEVEGAVALRSEQLLLAERAVAARTQALQLLIGQDLGGAGGELATEAVPVRRRGPARARALALASAHDPALAALAARRQAARLDLGIAGNGLLPQLDLTVEATLVGIDEERGAAVDALRAGNDHVVVASLELRLPLANRSARGARAAAEAELRALEHLEAELRARVALMVRDASEDGRIAEARVRLLASAVRAAQISLDAEQARFAVGRSTNFEVLRRQEELALARLRRLRAAVDLAKAHADLAALTGALWREHVEPAAE